MMAVIAEMMIFANSSVARRIADAFPDAALLRRHPPPRQDAFAEVCIGALGQSPHTRAVCAQSRRNPGGRRVLRFFCLIAVNACGDTRR